MAWTQQDAQQLKSLFQKAIKNGIEPVTALGGLPHEDDFELIGALTEGAMTDASKRHADHQYPVTAKANRKLPQSPTEPTGSKFEEGYMAPSMDVPYPSKVETIPAQSSLPPLPPGVISTAQWGKTKIGFGKFKGRDWSYQDLLSSPEEEARSYVKWCRARASSASGDLKDLAAFLFRQEAESSHGALLTGPCIPGTDHVRRFK